MLARYEFKYLLEPFQEGFVRDIASAFMEPDPHGARYSVYSLYFDSLDWWAADTVLDGILLREKLRIRTYGFDGKQPWFLEIKRRIGSSILKDRAMVPPAIPQRVVRGLPVEPELIERCRERDRPAVLKFLKEIDLLGMFPRLWVAYTREPWVSPFGDGARLTFDRDLSIQPVTEATLDRPDPALWVRTPLEHPTILEMKFNGASPAWMQRIVHQLGLQRISVSKYVTGVEQVRSWTGVVEPARCA